MNNIEQREKAVVELLSSIGEDPSREGLKETPNRVARMYGELFNGYDEDPKKHLDKVFEEGGDEIVIVRNIKFFSHCEHHMVPFFGEAHVAYIPNKKSKKVVGLSKIVRVVEGYAHRLQIQERLTREIAEAIQEKLDPQAVAVIISAKHMCMEMRGVKNPCADTVTSFMGGAFRENNIAREELLSLIKI